MKKIKKSAPLCIEYIVRNEKSGEVMFTLGNERNHKMFGCCDCNGAPVRVTTECIRES